ncbi:MULTISPECIES: tRNA (adenosine(37)-N6)-dimethylallyltransferase MiaA [unclassified Oleiphilus]|jgi:tRNA dimethylallyltransferase|nr:MULTISPECIES: tRNA (adenosine(37)-N6)-dimethylallyltransferase MiaA [unclassified Oleiphilus]KZY51555.1 tRNA (adenosine(37)-N6)-dimethylallyltransferase MiaA [Oleiphilus sp. HI0050]KZY86874.1 tRNA (adenosine(37)-N6)-dimethylallyltransferase MiaA [Oleiphilus sp. HI0069]KZZ07689.1 tRNA (adenosine(37)-N6)-dimethylallyltransferase MiaA [Oleiphilus sp. HI0078]KZY31688.1 tRNA (adenosine(37)-N6)-dimethylallyltransferase MiaA [Oleiphilus sp. HI0043]KZY64382.1 tRNA (adenosine(37)-N6)-dimethylallyltr
MTDSHQAKLVTILGPTASGKTSLAVELCRQFSGEIISADSRQVYRGMDIGTGKDLDEYEEVPHHLIDIVEPQEEFNLFAYAQHFSTAFTNIVKREQLPFLVGGTGMYLDAILNRYELTIAKSDEKARQEMENKSERELIELLLSFDKNLHNTTDLLSRDRIIKAIEIAVADSKDLKPLELPTFTPLTIGIRLEREEIKARITARLKARLEEGMIEEVETLRQQGLPWEKLHFFGLEYRFVAQYLQGELSYNDMYQKLNSAIHAFAKQQSKWFRNIEKKGQEIHWIDKGEDLFDKAAEHLAKHL